LFTLEELKRAVREQVIAYSVQDGSAYAKSSSSQPHCICRVYDICECGVCRYYDKSKCV
jgi:hypothetical protein